MPPCVGAPSSPLLFARHAEESQQGGTGQNNVRAWKEGTHLLEALKAQACGLGAGLQSSSPPPGLGWARAFRAGLPGLQSFEPGPANTYAKSCDRGNAADRGHPYPRHEKPAFKQAEDQLNRP